MEVDVEFTHDHMCGQAGESLMVSAEAEAGVVQLPTLICMETYKPLTILRIY
jgi:hypothetical protein